MEKPYNVDNGICFLKNKIGLANKIEIWSQLYFKKLLWAKYIYSMDFFMFSKL
jgi:hypothetical protein